LQEHIVDNPGTHKTHQNAVPLLGGVAIFIGFVLSMFIFSHLNGKIVSIFVGALILVIVGMFDDIYNMKPLVKLAGQSLAAVVVVLNNVSYYSIFMDTFRRLNLPDEVALVMLICFVVLMINAINLIDGLDGLAAGPSLPFLKKGLRRGGLFSSGTSKLWAISMEWPLCLRPRSAGRTAG